MLDISGLTVQLDEKIILNDFDFQAEDGKVHAIMGPNGTGKSTLGYTLAGRPGYVPSAGKAMLDGQDLLQMDAWQRARAGLFLAFQYPVEIPGVSNIAFLKAAVNQKRQSEGLAPLDAMDFLQKAKAVAATLDLDPSFLQRGVNEQFSGGEKKRNELLQMVMLEPKLAILDETDSGLDIDALKVIAEGVNNMRSKDRTFIIITHYQRLLDFIVPDVVHVMIDGKIVKSGDRHLALELEEKGYAWLQKPKVEC